MRVSDYFKSHKMCDETVVKHSKMFKFVPDCNKTRIMCEKEFTKSLFSVIHVLDQYKTQQMHQKVILKSPGMLQYTTNCCNILPTATNCYLKNV